LVAYTIYTNVTGQYRHLAGVYERLTPEALRTAEANADAFAAWAAPRVLDCACGIGLLAVGLALRGCEVHASDASPEMVARTRGLAAARGVEVHARVCAWEDLEPGGEFGTVFCVGNSLAHARDRRRALRGMAGKLEPGGTLVLTSRNWERERAGGSRVEDEDGIWRRWTIPEDWDAPHGMEVAVGGAREQLTFFPFRHETLVEDLAACGLAVAESTYQPEVERYLVTARVPLASDA
jgi:SAM-dependent methyltransferase